MAEDNPIKQMKHKIDILGKELKQLRREKSVWRKYKFFSNVADQLMTMIDRNYVYETVNLAYCKSRNQSPEDIVGLKVEQVWGKEKFETIIKSKLDKCFDGHVAYSEDWFSFSDEAPRCYQVSYHPYLDTDGNVSHAVVVTHDITERKNAEDALRKAHDKLEIRVKERTRELELAYAKLRDETDERKELETKLRHAQKMEAIGTLAGGIAHDFNNLLMGIQGNISLIDLETNDDDPVNDNIQSIEQLVESGGKLTRQLLGFARGGKYVVKALNINDLVNKSAQMFARTRKTINMETRLHERLWTVEADKGQIEQVLINLYLNAWQAMDENGSIHLETANVKIDKQFVRPYIIRFGNYVKITVKDSGRGIEKSIRHRIFEPFFTTRQMGRGSGLGLASVFGIVKNHGGFVDFSSEPEKGSVFDVYLPASHKKPPMPKIKEKAVLKGPETILLVDDESYILNVCGPMLEQMGYRVLIARNGKEALSIYDKNPDRIDLVILDLVMPDIGGGEVFDHIRSVNPDKRVLIASGCGVGDAAAIMERGCDGFIQKPFNMEQLSHSIRKILDSAHP